MSPERSADALENAEFYAPPADCSKAASPKHSKTKQKKKTKKQAVPWITKFIDSVKRFSPKAELSREDNVFESNGASMESTIKTEIPDWNARLSRASSLHTPVVIIVSMSAIRAVELIRTECKAFSSLCRIGKLFAKHFTIDEQRAYLKNNEVRVVVGTPHRLAMLIEEKSILLDQVKLIIFDLQPDSKGRTLLESNDTAKHVSLLAAEHLIPILNQGNARLCLHSK